jgi:hypothetical protein
VFSDLIHHVNDILSHYKVQIIRAPFSPLGQLGYLGNELAQFVHCIYAPTDMLVYNVERIITNIDFFRKQFTWVNKSMVLNDLKMTATQFLDFGLLLGGIESLPTFPLLSEPLVPFSFSHVYEYFMEFKSAPQILQFHASHPIMSSTDYADQFARMKACVQHHLVLTSDGIIEPLAKETAPSDLHFIFGMLFDDFIPFLISFDILSPQVITYPIRL